MKYRKEPRKEENIRKENIEENRKEDVREERDEMKRECIFVMIFLFHIHSQLTLWFTCNFECTNIFQRFNQFL